VQLIAIGPTTAAEMMRSLGRVDGNAARPEPQHVCHIVKQLNSTESPIHSREIDATKLTGADF